MELSISSLLAATIVFASTNIDDIVVLATFYSDPRFSRRAVIIGQFVGIGGLTAVSAIAAFFAMSVPDGWTALLGAVPLFMGLKKLWNLRNNCTDEESDSELIDRQKNTMKVHTQVLAVTAVTVANGGDNLGVYIPLFVSDTTIVPSYVAAFMVLTGLWCILGYVLVKNPAGTAVVNRWGHVILPMVLVVIGAHILWGAKVLFL